LSLANLADDPMFQLSTAHSYARRAIGMPAPAVQHKPPAKSEKKKLRIGYVSSDLRQHAVGFAMTDVVEQHDRERVEVYAYYCGIDRDDTTRQRIRRGVDSWCDINGLSDSEAARKIAADEIDVLVDLNGYTKD